MAFGGVQSGGVQSLKPLRNSHWLLDYPGGFLWPPSSLNSLSPIVVRFAGLRQNLTCPACYPDVTKSFSPCARSLICHTFTSALLLCIRNLPLPAVLGPCCCVSRWNWHAEIDLKLVSSDLSVKFDCER